MSTLGYVFDLQTYKLAGVTNLQRNPRKKDQFLIPSNVTLVEPPSPETYTAMEVPFYNVAKEEWSLVKSDYAEKMDEEKKHAMSPAGSFIYEMDVDGNYVERDPQEVADEDAVKLASHNKAVQKAMLVQTMENNLFLKGKEISGGATREAVMNDFQAYQIRVNNPEEYINEGYVAHYEIEGYLEGTELDNELAIVEYYTSLLITMDKFREAEKKAYRDAVFALDNPEQ